tara:strand:+ start:1143 stop:1472 length:330 start_codon:yes stop_codon:yes gene_type:complete
MELGPKELMTVGVVLAGLATTWGMVRQQMQRVLEDLLNIRKELDGLNSRLDQAESSTAVFTHQISVLGNILSPEKLAAQHRELASIRASLDSITSEVSTLRHMHNGKHP